MNILSCVRSAGGEVGDIEAVRTIIAAYDVSIPLTVIPFPGTDGGILAIDRDADEEATFPSAIRRDSIPTDIIPNGANLDDLDEEAYEDFLDYRGTHGSEGLQQLLRELIPFLQTDFILQDFEYGWKRICSATQWRIRPGTSDVEITEIGDVYYCGLKTVQFPIRWSGSPALTAVGEQGEAGIVGERVVRISK